MNNIVICNKDAREKMIKYNVMSTICNWMKTVSGRKMENASLSDDSSFVWYAVEIVLNYLNIRPSTHPSVVGMEYVYMILKHALTVHMTTYNSRLILHAYKMFTKKIEESQLVLLVRDDIDVYIARLLYNEALDQKHKVMMVKIIGDISVCDFQGLTKVGLRELEVRRGRDDSVHEARDGEEGARRGNGRRLFVLV